ncbi:DUF6966 domain-containing protein [Polluticoccus soli]|uniref:DUF6966 domain-containing protein n=1 Tax=Polluticoccus soli TaxID=3034150 RepID=UPI0023E0BB3D|nr:hypothetical protein [Flavipsychrobacter sp. JY13-12]
MDTYRKALVILESLFRQSGNSHWAKWMMRDIYEWDTHRSTTHHRSAFGGMGSINDQPLGKISEEGCWKDTLFDYIKTISWTYATKGENEILVSPPPTFQITLCNNCGYLEITDLEIERFLAKRHLPALINTYLQQENFEDLLDVRQVLHSEEVEEERVALKQNYSKNKIAVTNRLDRIKTCPNCNTTHFTISTWHVTKNQPLEITMKKTWWRQLVDIFKG